MHDDRDPEIEYSPLCEKVTQDGLTVRVQIYRLKTGNNGWSLEVVDHENASTVWDDLFATDHEALAEFSRTLEDEGIQSFLVDRARLNGLPHLFRRPVTASRRGSAIAGDRAHFDRSHQRNTNKY